MWARQLPRRASSALRRPAQAEGPFAWSCSSEVHHQRQQVQAGGSLFPLEPLRGFLRSFAATRRSAADNYLVEVLKSEIQQAKKPDLLKGSTGPFELVDKPGNAEVELIRTFGDEKITVTCMLENQGTEEVESSDAEQENAQENAQEENAPIEVIHMYCNITKGESKRTVAIHGSYVVGAAEVMVEAVEYVNEEEIEPEKRMRTYDPAFMHLDDNLIRAFHDLIKARGLSTKLAAYLIQYMKAKEDREYLLWLQNMESFFSP